MDKSSPKTKKAKAIRLLKLKSIVKMAKQKGMAIPEKLRLLDK